MQAVEHASVPPGVIIRPMAACDSAEEITALLHRAFAIGPDQPFAYPVATQTVEDTVRQIEKGGCWIATVDGNLAGAAIVYAPTNPFRSPFDRAAQAHLSKLAVDSGFQNKGIGARLLKAAEEGALAMGSDYMWASSPVGARQLSLYLRNGYRFNEYVRWASTDYDSVIFSRRLRGTDPLSYHARRILRLSGSVARRKLGLLNGGVRGALKRTAGSVIWYGAKIGRAVGVGERRHVLLCCNDPLMAGYARHLVDLLRDDRRLDFKLSVPPVAGRTIGEDCMRAIDQQLPFRRVDHRWARVFPWDLVVAAGDFRDFVPLSPTVYIGDGENEKVLSAAAPPGKAASSLRRELYSLLRLEEPGTNAPD